MSKGERSSEHLIVVIGFDAVDQVTAAVKRFRAFPIPPDVIVIENGSAEYDGDLTVFRPLSNTGYCGAANVGITFGFKSGYRAVTIANFDIEVPTDSFERLTESIASADDDVAVIGGIELDSLGLVTTSGGMSWSRWTGTEHWRRSMPSKITEVLFAQGAFVTFLPPVLRLTKVFDERLFMFFDEIDLGLRLKDVGLSAIVDPGVVYRHENIAGRYRPLRGYLMWRNRGLIIRQRSGFRSPIAFSLSFFRLVLGAAARAPRIQPAYFLSSLRGLFDGARGIHDLQRVPGLKYLGDSPAIN